LVELSKLFLNKPDVGVKAFIVVPVDYADELLNDLVHKSLLEPLPAGEVSREVEKLKSRLELALKVERLVQELSKKLPGVVEVEVKELPWDIDEALAKLHAELSETLEVVRALEAEAGRLEELREKLSALKALLSKARELGVSSTELVLDYEGPMIVVKTLYGKSDAVKALEGASLKTLLKIDVPPDKQVALVVFDRESYEKAKQEVSKLEIRPRDLKVAEGGDFGAVIDSQIAELERGISSIREKIRSVVESKSYEMGLAKILAEGVASKVGVLKEALESRYLTVVAGWTLKSRLGELESIVKKRRGTVVIEKATEPHVEFNNLRPFKPFELFTEIMGYPSPHEWDPTPLLTYLYLIFFSLMFPDVGYAIGLILGSRLVLPYFVENKETLSRLIKISTYAGIAGAFAGLLSGSFFGSLLGSYISAVIPPVLPSLPPRLEALEAISSAILRYLGLALGVGYFTVLLSHSIGLYKNIAARNKTGAASELIVVALMILAPPAIKATIGLNTDVLGLLRFVPSDVCVKLAAGLLVAYALLRSIADRPFGAMLWIFDVLGVMADVLSFVRIAGIAIGSAIMAELLNSLILNLYAASSAISAFLGFAVGFVAAATLHVVNLGLSSISPFVHSLRLVMYEVSSKFYEGSGRRISPKGVRGFTVRIGGGVK
jgi:V/A-type H+-transporting ATPase subunit I